MNEKLIEALAQIYEQFGLPVLKNGDKTCAFLSDLAPHMVKERKLLRNVYANAPEAMAAYVETLSSSGDGQKAAYVLRRQLEDNYMSEEAIVMVMDTYTAVLAKRTASASRQIKPAPAAKPAGAGTTAPRPSVSGSAASGTTAPRPSASGSAASGTSASPMSLIQVSVEHGNGGSEMDYIQWSKQKVSIRDGKVIVPEPPAGMELRVTEQMYGDYWVEERWVQEVRDQQELLKQAVVYSMYLFFTRVCFLSAEYLADRKNTSGAACLQDRFSSESEFSVRPEDVRLLFQGQSTIAGSGNELGALVAITEQAVTGVVWEASPTSSSVSVTEGRNQPVMTFFFPFDPYEEMADLDSPFVIHHVYLGSERLCNVIKRDLLSSRMRYHVFQEGPQGDLESCLNRLKTQRPDVFRWFLRDAVRLYNWASQILRPSVFQDLKRENRRTEQISKVSENSPFAIRVRGVSGDFYVLDWIPAFTGYQYTKAGLLKQAVQYAMYAYIGSVSFVQPSELGKTAPSLTAERKGGFFSSSKKRLTPAETVILCSMGLKGFRRREEQAWIAVTKECVCGIFEGRSFSFFFQDTESLRYYASKGSMELRAENGNKKEIVLFREVAATKKPTEFAIGLTRLYEWARRIMTS